MRSSPTVVPQLSMEVDIPLVLRGIPVRAANISAASRIVVHSAPQSLGADRFRYLRLRLREHRKSRKLQTVIITSPLPLDGKSTTTLNLATSLAEGGRRSVLCVEADLHHPTLARALGIECTHGIRGVHPRQAGSTLGDDANRATGLVLDASWIMAGKPNGVASVRWPHQHDGRSDPPFRLDPIRHTANPCVNGHGVDFHPCGRHLVGDTREPDTT